jgi:hypothetical protein
MLTHLLLNDALNLNTQHFQNLLIGRSLQKNIQFLSTATILTGDTTVNHLIQTPFFTACHFSPLIINHSTSYSMS